jgi:hypothetical protein
MGQRVWTETYATKAEAKQGLKRTLLHAVPGYSERYVARGPFEYKTMDGRTRWAVEFKEYYG